MKKKVLFYSSVSDLSLFKTQRFYYIDITLLEKNGFVVDSTNKIYRFFFFWKYDIAFLYFYKFSFFCGLIAKMFKKKIYFTGGIDALERSFNTKKNFFIQKLFFKLCYLISDRCFVVSKSDEKNIKCLYSRNNLKKIFFSPHTIEPEIFQSYLSNKGDVFSTIAWMESKENVIRKGVDSALKLFAYLCKQEMFLNSIFVIIGKMGEGSDYLKELCIELNIQNKVIFTNSLSENKKVEYLKYSRYYFQLSLYEGFGIAALEALASKNIVIHSGKGGLKETIKDYGILVDLLVPDEIVYKNVYEQLISFDSSILEFAEIYVKNHFSNYRRQLDFFKIIGNN